MRISVCVFAAIVMSATPASAREYRAGGKLLLTDGVTTVEGASGGGLATWALIGGQETDAGIGGGGSLTALRTGRFTLTTAGAKLGVFNRVELSVARQRFDTHSAGAELGLGRGFTLGQTIIGAKLRLVGDPVYDGLLPQISIGLQRKAARQGALLRAVGARRTHDVDFMIAATKVILAQGMVIDATARLTRANQFGLLGFGGDLHPRRSLQFEGSAGKLLSRRVLVGAELRTKPDNVGFAREQRAFDLFAAFAATRHLTVTAAYADLGSIASFSHQRGLYLSLQGAL